MLRPVTHRAAGLAKYTTAAAMSSGVPRNPSGTVAAMASSAPSVPRTWWKGLTNAVGLLDADYPENSGGLDRWCLEDSKDPAAILKTLRSRVDRVDCSTVSSGIHLSAEELRQSAYHFEDGFLHPGDLPGLGVDYDEELGVYYYYTDEQPADEIRQQRPAPPTPEPKPRPTAPARARTISC